MSDWREHIENEPKNPSLRGTEVEVSVVLRLLGDGWTVERVLARFPALTTDSVHACIAYAAELVERAKLREEMLRRIKEATDRPDLLIPHEEVMRQLLEDEANDPEPEEDG